MDRHKPARNPYLLISGVSGYILLAAFINIYPPDSLWKIGLFLVASTISTGLILHYIFQRTQLSVLWSLGAAIFLTLRFFGLKSPIYAILLLACIVSFELLWKRK